MHGDGHCGVHHRDGLLNINGIFENRFDIIITNPPFGSRIERSLNITEADCITDLNKIRSGEDKYGVEVYRNAISQVNSNVGKSLLDIYEVGKFSGLTEILFLERCLRLLKPGGRLGIVLPEGVLNNTNLQNVREYFESMAKIILIVSIPQDVFMASGATVKPSLMFFKKFTEEELKQYELAKREANEQVSQKYEGQIVKLKTFIDDKQNSISERKAKRYELRNIEEKINKEVKPIIRQLFNYRIPVATVKKAGITTTGSDCYNELDDLLREYSPYRKEHKLWIEVGNRYDYKINNNQLLKRLNKGEWEIMC